jgi:hypothetical protein
MRAPGVYLPLCVRLRESVHPWVNGCGGVGASVCRSYRGIRRGEAERRIAPLHQLRGAQQIAAILHRIAIALAAAATPVARAAAMVMTCADVARLEGRAAGRP